MAIHENFKYHGRGVDDHHRVDQVRRIHWVSAARRVPPTPPFALPVKYLQVGAQKKKEVSRSTRSVINTQKDNGNTLLTTSTNAIMSERKYTAVCKPNFVACRYYIVHK